METEKRVICIRIVQNGLIIHEQDRGTYVNAEKEAVYQNDLDALKDAVTRLLGKKEDYSARETIFLDALISLSHWAIEVKQEILLKLNTEKINKSKESEPKKADSDDGIPF